MARYHDKSLEFFSVLPESVIHHILSFLPFKHIGRTSVLSKAWNRIWLNYPNINLVLHEAVYKLTHPLGRPFLDHVLMFFHQCLFRKACVHKMHINISVSDLERYSPILGHMFSAAIERNVSELVIKVRCYKSMVWYSVPAEVVLSHSLKVLELVGCTLGDRIANFDLAHLQKFKICSCRFANEDGLSRIICGCPKIEFLEVSDCMGLGSFLSIPSKSRLKSFKIVCNLEPNRIRIFTPSLETLYCFGIKPCSIDFACCTRLKRLGLGGDIDSADFVHIQNFLSKLCYIEEFKLLCYRGLDKFQISSSRLKRLIIEGISIFPGAEIDTPNLRSLEFISSWECSSNLWFCSWNVPKLEEFHMALSVENFQSACRGGVKGFLMKLRNYEGLKLLIQWLHDEGGDFIMHEKLHAVPFSALNKFLKRVKPSNVIISSKRDESLFTNMLGDWKGKTNLSLISSSRRNIEVLHKRLSIDESIMCSYSECKLVPIEEVKHKKDPVFKSFLRMQSKNGYHCAGIIFTK
ncbi:unnamed protein product [Cuscuta campestris]|uniref:F-box domain-containing protein n=1 Tax=Cuscuta campestris TaxID=132261 RepID=A0A484K6C2_9ASTE|nr:unnamed protein product [Cuscuta campestris]